MFRLIACTILILACAQSAIALDSLPEENPSGLQEYSFFTDTRNLTTLTLGLSTTYFLYKNDQKYFDKFMNSDNRARWHERVLSFSRHYGKINFFAPLLGSMWLGTLSIPDSKLALATHNALTSFALSGLIVTALKITFQRHRPEKSSDPYIFEGIDHFEFNNETLSFPSGDAQLAWSVLTSYAMVFGENSIWTPIFTYSIAGLVTLGRVYDKAHWPSDAFLGSLIGYITAYNVYKYQKAAKDRSSVNQSHFSFTPIVTAQKFGVGFSYNY